MQASVTKSVHTRKSIASLTHREFVDIIRSHPSAKLRLLYANLQLLDVDKSKRSTHPRALVRTPAQVTAVQNRWVTFMALKCLHGALPVVRRVGCSYRPLLHSRSPWFQAPPASFVAQNASRSFRSASR